jgi:hypothetical protein
MTIRRVQSAFWPRFTADWLQHRSLLAARSQLHAKRAMAAATHRDVVSSHRFCTQNSTQLCERQTSVNVHSQLLCIFNVSVRCYNNVEQGRVMWGPTVQTPVMISPSYPSSRTTFSRLGLPAVMRARAAPTSANAMHRKTTTGCGMLHAWESSSQEVTAVEAPTIERRVHFLLDQQVLLAVQIHLRHELVVTAVLPA